MSSPVKYSIDLSSNILLLNFEGAFELFNFDVLSEAVLNDQQYVSHLNRIYDYSHCDKIVLTTTEIMSVVESSREWTLNEGTKIALVASGQEDAGLLRILAASIGRYVVKVFLSQSEATHWQNKEASQLHDNLSNVVHRTIRFQGTIGLEEILAAQIELTEAGSEENKLPLLWDLRQATIMESIDSVCDMAVYIAANHERDRDGVRSAVLVDSHLNELLYRKMTTVDNWPEDESKVFRSYREAVSWLGIS